MFSTKKSVTDVWPINKKRFLVLVDPETVTDEEGAASCIPTIAFLLSKGAKVIVACSFGNIRGVPLNLSDKHREGAIRAFQNEEGMGLTSFFSALTQKEKVDVLSHVEGLSAFAKSCSATHGTGKTTFFEELPTETKLSAILSRYPSATFARASTLQLVEKFQRLLEGVTVVHAEDPLHAHEAVERMAPKSMILLENLRFYRNEVSKNADDRRSMAEVIASYCDVFVNDSFATAADLKCSTVEIPRLLRHGAAGLLLTKELSYFRRLLTHPARPIGVVVGGTHLEAKLPLIYSLVGKVDKILIAGEVALPFLAAKGLCAGKGYDESQCVELDGETVRVRQLASKILRQAAATGVSIVLPSDHVTHTDREETRDSTITCGASIPSELFSLDAGPATLQSFAEEIRTCRTIVWTGTFGMTTVRGFESGSEHFAQVLAGSGIFSVVAGNNTTRCVRKVGAGNGMSHLSSGGMACLEILKANLLPAVEALSDANSDLDQKAVASVVNLLRHLPLFSGCGSHQLSLLAKKAVRRAYAAGDFLIYDGDRYTSMFLVSSGSLMACPKSLYGCSSAARKVVRGHAVGLYEFVTRHASTETVQVAENDTVVYQLPCTALKEAMNEAPEFSSQLVANLSHPLRMIAAAEHQTHMRTDVVLLEDISHSRCPLPSRSIGRWGSVAVEVVMECLLHKVSLRYHPQCLQSGSCVLARVAHGLGARILFSIVRNFVYHLIAPNNPFVAALCSAVTTVPLRLLASGVPLHGMQVDDALDAAALSAVASLAPIASHALLLNMRSLLELAQRKSLRSAQVIALAAACRVCVGLVAFPFIAHRNRCERSALTFTFYALKQVLGLLLTMVLNRIVKQQVRKKF